MKDHVEFEKEHSHYVGDVVNGLMREAAYWKARFNGASAEIERLKIALQQKSGEPDHYIFKEYVEPQRPSL
ncbi:MAG: hypothetical protein ING36_03615 [Burkholderiales bacterium]|jgi:hypothetical protein|nr:hypothetical protein [Burkholderiales bacterium]